MDKPFWKSKTIWANVLTFAGTFLAQQLGVANLSAEEVGATFAFVNLILRFVTKGAVTLS